LGLIAKEGSRNVVLMYLGAVLGAINTILLYPNILPSEEYGMINSLMSVAILISGISAFGSNSSVIKFIPYFRDNENKNNGGLITFLLSVTLVISILVTAILILLKDYIQQPFEENSKLLVDFYYFIIPLFIVNLLIDLFSSYANSLFKTSFQIFLKEVFLRLGQTFLIFLYYKNIIEIREFVIGYFLIYLISFLLIIAYLYKRKEIKLVGFKRIQKKKRVEILQFGGYTFFSTIAATFAFRIDALMLGAIVSTSFHSNSGLAAVAVYFVALNMAAVIDLPFRAISQIINPLVSKFWKEDALNDINKLYYKSTETMIIIGGFIFVGIWACIDDVMKILPPDYESAKYVFFWLGLGKLINVACGSNATILINSKYFKFFTVMTLIGLVITFVTNYFFIHEYGTVGAAIATCITYFILNLVMFLFLYIKFNFQPFRLGNFFSILILVLVYLLVFKINIINPWLGIVTKASLISLLFWFLIYKLKLSEDITSYFNRILKYKK
jgi:O-antigen/teichoic acid export membrane protein